MNTSKGNTKRENGVEVEGIQPNRIRPIKVTAVGDGMVGKTCLLITYVSKRFPTEYVPTVFDNYADNITVDGQDFNMTLWDTAGQEDYERLRPLSYPNTDCFLLCFSVSSRTSYENVISKWCPELKHHMPHVPIVLVGTKIDLREDDPECISFAEGKKLKQKIRAARYVECSAIKGEGLQDVFVEAIRAVMKKPPTSRRTCNFL
ncbi:ras-like GTP-binding protein RhoL isoform X3 [Periplaneta americana]